ncbi:MAG: thiamine diphosphokinase, partial [Clostridia bacterium]|nr:thiamine diphosphokinase [Clostridia bacterium]
MSRICAIIAGGEFSPFCEIERADFIIACDKGYGYAKEQGIIPHLVIGDFDSYKGDIPKDIPTTLLPCEKDETDTMAAFSYAVKNGFDTVFLYCALGGRLDHLLGNLQAAEYAAKSGLSVRITGKN